MNSLAESLNSVAVPPPQFDVPTIAAVVQQQYGLSGRYRPLVSERDQNFAFESSDGQRFVIKISSLAETDSEIDLQIAALLHLEQAKIDFVPRVIANAEGGHRATVVNENGEQYSLRTVSWVDGRLLADCSITADVAEKFGDCLAELDQALLNFSHPASERVLLWDTQTAGVLQSLTHHIDAVDVRKRVEDVLGYHADKLESALKQLPQQVIHNDANPENVLLGSGNRIAGLIDFGDMLRAPRIVDVATAASYLRADVADPLLLIAPFVAGYCSRQVLQQDELLVLYHSIRTRLAMTLTILYWRLSARDVNDPYRQKTLTSESNAFDFLERLTALGEGGFLSRIIQKE